MTVLISGVDINLAFASGDFLYVAPRVSLIRQKIDIGETQWETRQGMTDWETNLEDLKDRMQDAFFNTLHDYLLWSEDARGYWKEQTIKTFMETLTCDFIVVGCNGSLDEQNARLVFDRLFDGVDSVNGVNYYDRQDIKQALSDQVNFGMYYEPQWVFFWMAFQVQMSQIPDNAQMYIDSATNPLPCTTYDSNCMQGSIGNMRPFGFPYGMSDMAFFMPDTYSDPDNPDAEYTPEELFELYWPASSWIQQELTNPAFRPYPQGIVNFAGPMVPITGSSGKNSHFVPSLAFGMDLHRLYDIPVRLEIEGSLLYKGQKTGFPEYRLGAMIPSPGEDPLFFNMLSNTDINYKINTLYLNAFLDWHNSTKFTPFIGGGIGAAFVSLRVFRIYNLNFRDQYFNPDDQDDRGPLISSSAISYDYYKKAAKPEFSWHLSVGVSYSLTDSIDFELMYRYTDLGFKRTIDQFPYPAGVGVPNMYFENGIPSGNQGSVKYGSTEIDLSKAEQITVGLRYRF